jgi:hypothetical protein
MPSATLQHARTDEARQHDHGERQQNAFKPTRPTRKSGG